MSGSAARPPRPSRVAGLTWRLAEPTDAEAVGQAIDAWWPGIHMVHAVCPQLFEHLGDTCMIVEDDGRLVGFLVGFLSQRLADTGYVHYAGVHPDYRGRGIGRELYRRFSDEVRRRGGTRLLAETGTWNVKSIAFHRDLGFTILPGDEEVDGLPVSVDHGPQGDHVVRFELRLDEADSGAGARP